MNATAHAEVCYITLSDDCRLNILSAKRVVQSKLVMPGYVVVCSPSDVTRSNADP